MCADCVRYLPASAKIEKVITYLWASPLLTVQHKKNLANHAVGFCGKRSNRKADTLVFQDASVARHYRKLLGGSDFNVWARASS